MKSAELSPEYKAKLISEERGATDILQDDDGRLWYTNSLTDWRYEGQCLVIRASLTETPKPNAGDLRMVWVK